MYSSSIFYEVRHKIDLSWSKNSFSLKRSLDSNINTHRCYTDKHKLPSQERHWSTAGSLGCKRSEQGLPADQDTPNTIIHQGQVECSMMCSVTLPAPNMTSAGQDRLTGSTVFLLRSHRSGDICFLAVFTEVGQEQFQRLPGGSLLGLKGSSASIKWGTNECFKGP